MEHAAPTAANDADRGRGALLPALPSETANAEAVLAEIGAASASSRAAVARRLGLSRTTISTIVTRLIGLGLVVETSTRITGRGRPGINLELDVARWRAVGAEYHSGKWTFVATNLKGEIAASSTLAVLRNDAPAFLGALIGGLRAFIAGIGEDILPAVGIGAPGLVDCERGVIVRADDLGWKEVGVAAAVRQALGLDALLVNRNRASGLAEARFGAGRGVHNLVYIGIGTGISAAFILDGVLLNGSSFSAGEIGHTVVDSAGPRCGCGKQGCLQVYASGSAMVAHATALIAAGRASSLAGAGRPPAKPNGHAPLRALDGEAVCRAAAEGDAVANECVAEAARYMALETANIITSFNPDKVVIGGPIGLIDGPFIDLVRSEASRWALPDAFAIATIERGQLGESVGALGAACQVLDRALVLAQRGVRRTLPVVASA
jgi:predicted NBD/HSP70 family sugar kinase/biotin operon repressor